MPSTQSATPTKFIAVAGLAAAFLLTVTAARLHAGDDDYTVTAPPQTQEKTFTLSGTTPPELSVDDVVGSIHVVGDGNGQIRMSARELVRGATQADVEEAAKEVHLDLSQDGNTVKVYVDGPFRCGQGCTWNGQMHWHSPDYVARFDFELHVPANTKLTLKTITGGRQADEAKGPDILVERTSGDYHLNDINGGVQLNEVSGAGEVRTINGQITASYQSNPRADVSFSTINGAVHLYLQPGLSADLHYKTMNGDVYSDFAATPQATAEPANREANGLRLYRSGRNAVNSLRVGTGGPVIALNTLNGNIFIHKHS